MKKRLLISVMLIVLLCLSLSFTACDTKPNCDEGHTYGDWNETSATCTEAGTLTRTCTVCNEPDSKEVPALGHDYSRTYTNDLEPTCDTEGSKSRHCTRCDSKTDETSIPSLGHLYGSWETQTEAACETEGSRIRHCTRENCNDSETTKVAALGHKYSEEWTVDKEPTCDQAGSKSRYCTRCSNSNTDITEIPAIGHSYSQGNCTVCGAEDPSLTSDEDGIMYTLSSDGKYYIIISGTAFAKTDLVVRETFNNIPVTEIADNAFAGCSKITSVVIPDTVTSIGKNIFAGCGSIESMTVPFIGKSASTRTASKDTLLGYLFGETAFSGATLTKQCYKYGYDGSYYIPDSLKTVTVLGGNVLYGTFYGCSKIETIEIGDKVKGVGEKAFYGCTSLTEITVNNFEIGFASDAFEQCSSMKFAEHDNGKYIGNSENPYLTMLDTKAEDILSCEIHPDTKSINIGAFGNCYYITEVVIPDGVEFIHEEAFTYCVGLASIVVGAGVKDIDSDAFEYCYSLVEIYNKSSLKIETESSRFGGIAKVAMHVYNTEGESKLDTVDNNIFYIDGNSISFIKHIGIETEITLPDSYKGNNYAVYQYAFFNCSTLTSVVIPSGVIEICAGVFRGCGNIQKMTLPFIGRTAESGSKTNGVLGYLFGNASYFGGVSIQQGNATYYIPATLTEINVLGHRLIDNAFYGCSNLVTISLGKTTSVIGIDVFNGCTSLTTVNYAGSLADWCAISFANEYSNPMVYTSNICIDGNMLGSEISITGVQKLKPYTFYGYDKLTKFTVNNEVTEIADAVIANCENLTDFYYTGDLTSWMKVTFVTANSNPIGYVQNAYIGNMKITGNIVIPNNITEISKYAFANSKTVTSIVIPSSVKNIAVGAFYGCTALETITIPFIGTTNGATVASATTVFGAIFGDELYDGGLLIDQCYEIKTVEIPSTWGQEGGIAEEPQIAEYCVPKSLKTVVVTGGNVLFGSFYNCSALTSVTLPNSIETIGNQAFNGCTSLPSFIIPDSVTSIGEKVFYGCTSLKDITISESMDNLSAFTFGSCTALVEIYIPSSITTVSEFAFSGCSSLKTVVVPDNVTLIGSSAFAECTNLTSITIGMSVATIGNDAFLHCYSLVEINNRSALDLKAGAQENGLVSLYAIYIYNSGATRLVENNGFMFYVDGNTVHLIKYYGNDTELVLPDKYNGQSYTIYNYAFYKCSKLTSITIGSDVTAIGDYAFYGCSAISTIIVPDKVTSIGEAAFYSCNSLTSVVLGSGLTEIKDNAFFNCGLLAKVYYKGASATAWAAVNVSSTGNDSLTNASMYYYSETQQSVGNYWHYVDGVPTEW